MGSAPMSIADKMREKIEFHEKEAKRIRELLKGVEEFETEVAEPDTRAGRKREKTAVSGRAETIKPASGRFRDAKIVDAAITLLRENAAHPLDTHQIVAGLEAGGYQTDSKDFYNTVHALLHRESKKPRGRITRSGKQWALTGFAVSMLPERNG